MLVIIEMDHRIVMLIAAISAAFPWKQTSNQIVLWVEYLVKLQSGCYRRREVAASEPFLNEFND